MSGVALPELYKMGGASPGSGGPPGKSLGEHQGRGLFQEPGLKEPDQETRMEPVQETSYPSLVSDIRPASCLHLKLQGSLPLSSPRG